MDKTFYRRLRQPVPANQTQTSKTARPARYGTQLLAKLGQTDTLRKSRNR